MSSLSDTLRLDGLIDCASAVAFTASIMWTLKKGLRNHNYEIQELHSTRTACLYLWEEMNIFKAVRFKKTTQVDLLLQV